MLDEILEDAESRMESAVEHTRNEFATLRTGRANPAILSRITVDYYGAQTPLRQLASTTVPEPRMLLVHPFDPGVIGQIERAIQKSDLGLNPASDGRMIRLVFPPLTEERRRDLIRVAGGIAEGGAGGDPAYPALRAGRLGGTRRVGGHRPAAEKKLQDCHDRYIAKTDRCWRTRNASSWRSDRPDRRYRCFQGRRPYRCWEINPAPAKCRFWGNTGFGLPAGNLRAVRDSRTDPVRRVSRYGRRGSPPAGRGGRPKRHPLRKRPISRPAQPRTGAGRRPTGPPIRASSPAGSTYGRPPANTRGWPNRWPGRARRSTSSRRW